MKACCTKAYYTHTLEYHQKVKHKIEEKLASRRLTLCTGGLASQLCKTLGISKADRVKIVCVFCGIFRFYSNYELMNETITKVGKVWD